MRVRGVLALLGWIDLEIGLVDEDVRVHQRVRNMPRRQGFEDLVAHHRADVSVLDQDNFALRTVDLGGHGLYLHSGDILASANTSARRSLLHKQALSKTDVVALLDRVVAEALPGGRGLGASC